MSDIIRFYSGEEVNGWTLEKVLNLTNEEYDNHHDFIQLVFPLPEPSRFNPNAPLLNQEDITFLKSNIFKVYDQFIRFDEYIDNLIKQKVDINDNHAKMRITRVIRCLTLLNEMMVSGYMLFRAKRRFNPSLETREHWNKAAGCEILIRKR